MNYYIITAEFNAFITDPMTEACVKAFEAQNIKAIVVKVPGALEIPIMAQHIIKKYNPKAIVTIGCLIKGETDHYKAICEMVSQGVMRLMLDHQVPIVFEVLMVDSIKKAEDRIEKGTHAAYCATRMAGLLT